MATPSRARSQKRRAVPEARVSRQFRRQPEPPLPADFTFLTWASVAAPILADDYAPRRVGSREAPAHGTRRFLHFLLWSWPRKPGAVHCGGLVHLSDRGGNTSGRIADRMAEAGVGLLRQCRGSTSMRLPRPSTALLG
jgi:hypothetical protein